MNQYIMSTAIVILTASLIGCSNCKPPQYAMHHDTIKLVLNDPNGAQVGTAQLDSTNNDNQTSVSIQTKNEPPNETQYAFFQYGQCSGLQPSPLYPLNDVVNNASTYTYNLPMGTVIGLGPGDGSGHGPGGEGGSDSVNPPPPPTHFAVTVWRYTTTGKTMLACGDHPIG